MKRLLAVTLVTACWSSSQPSTPPAPAKSEPIAIQPKQAKVKDIVQPIKIERRDDPCGADPCGGVVGGVVGGDVGDIYGAPPPPPPPPPAPPQNVAPTLLEGNRLAGDKAIVPDDKTKVAIMQSGKDKIIGSWKLCLSTNGAVTTVAQLKSTGFPDYDTKIATVIRNTWKYRPYEVNGRAVPVCTAVTFIYSQTPPPPPPPNP